MMQRSAKLAKHIMRSLRKLWRPLREIILKV